MKWENAEYVIRYLVWESRNYKVKDLEHKIDCATNAAEICDGFAAMGCTCGADKQNKLKPCPFCGGAAQFWNKFNKEYWVRCDKCNCKTPVLFSETEAMKFWNTRVEKEAKEMCKKQRQICASEYHKNTNPICLDSKTFNKILNATLATDNEKETRI